MQILSKMRKSRGFTLVELMIVVVIIGILAALAIYGVRKYVANSKTAEARLGLGSISKSAITAYEGESMSGSILALKGTVASSQRLCQSASAAVPTTVPKGQKYQSTDADWKSPADAKGTPTGWTCLKFSMTGPQYFQYSYTATSSDPAAAGDKYTAGAAGDLDSDGAPSSFSLSGEIKTDSATNGLVLAVSPAVVEVNPEE